MFARLLVALFTLQLCRALEQQPRDGCARFLSLPAQTAPASPTQRRPFVYLHLPKAAGTSMRHLLRRSAENTSLALNVCDDLDIPRTLLQDHNYGSIVNCDVVVAHVPYGIMDGYNAAKKPLYSVMLREPIARTLSLYHYVRRSPEHYQFEHFQNKTLPQLIRRDAAMNTDGAYDFDVGLLVRNRMTWWLCGHDCHPSTMSLSHALSRAVDNLLFNISVVGVVESSGEFVRALAHALPWLSPSTALEHANAREKVSLTAKSSAEMLTDEDRALMRATLAADLYVYSIAQKIADQQSRCLNGVKENEGVRKHIQSARDMLVGV
eukprot:m.2820 g.2820  ORF g.2820 m.2820 type:complete len:322 (+) comp2770_c0_seq1:218-1183(+)